MLVEAARKLGINALHHQGFESTRTILEKLKNEPINLHEFNGRS
jgi:putative hydrolase of the HAD superfamily